VNINPEHQEIQEESEVSGLTPLLGHRNFQGDLEVFTSNKQEAFKRITDEYPEESFFFLNEKKLKTRARLLRENFLPPAEGGRVAYAVKANPRRKILKLLGQAKITSFDCASDEEIDTVLNGNPHAEILYNHPVKRNLDIRFALKRGVRHFTVQTIREVVKILENSDHIDFEDLEIAVRLDTPNPDAEINLSEKFGAEEETAQEIIKLIKLHGSNPGISIHTGSQNTNPESFSRGIKQMLALAEKEGGIRSINIGGGLPANIHTTDDFNPEVYLNVINTSIRESLKRSLERSPKIYMEPGRAMVAECIDLLIPILSVEMRRGEKVLYIYDGIFTSFSDAIIHGWKYPFQFWRKNQKDFSGKTISFGQMFGRTCDSGDKLGYIEGPEDLQEGDYIHIPRAGAYMDSQASHFNGFGTHRYVSYNM